MAISDAERNLLTSWEVIDSRKEALSVTINSTREALAALERQGIREQAPQDIAAAQVPYAQLGEAHAILHRMANILPGYEGYIYRYLGPRTASVFGGADTSPMTTAYTAAEGHTALPPLEALPEYNLLIGANIKASAEAATGSADDSEIEAKRTKLMSDCLQEGWTGKQQKLSKLTDEEFTEFHQFVREACDNDSELYATVSYWAAIHDIGKNSDVREAVNADEDTDHDEVFRKLVCDPEHRAARDRLLPSWALLSERGQQVIERGTAARFNYPQTLQGEAPASSLIGIHEETDANIRDLDILKSIVDIAGALGHVNSDTSLTLTSSTWRRMKNLNAALRDPQLSTAAERNNAFLDKEADYMFGALTINRELQSELDESRALARLSCHLRLSDTDDFVDLMGALYAQSPLIESAITEELNSDGITERATLPYYGPALFGAILKQTGSMDDAVYHYGLILHEARRANELLREAGHTGVSVAQLGDVVTKIQSGEFDIRRGGAYFLEKDGRLSTQVYQFSSRS